MLRKMRRAMADRDSIYSLGGLVEVDDAFVGGRSSRDKRGRGTEGKTPILVAVESRGKKAALIVMEATSSVSGETSVRSSNAICACNSACARMLS